MLLIVTGLFIFLYVLNRLSDALKELTGDKMKSVLDRFISNVFKGILNRINCYHTTRLFFRSYIMTIALVNAWAMSFRQAMGAVMGANIGTTISSQIFALNVSEYAAVPITAGLLLMIIHKNKIYKEEGMVLFSFGLIFFGLFTMEEAVAPLRNSNYFASWMHSLDITWKELSTGAFVTLVIQSSSATVGMQSGFATKGLISLPAGIAIMLGAQLSACSDTLVATIGRNRQAIRTGVFHLLFNIVAISLGVIFLRLFTSLVFAVSGQVEIAQK